MFVLLSYLLFFFSLPSTLSFFFGGGCGGGCGCQMSCPPPIQLPSLCLPPPPPCMCLPPIQLPSLCLPPMPSPCGCGRKKRSSSIMRLSSSNETCGNEILKGIIVKHLSSSATLSETQSLIHSESKSRLGGNWIVYCTQGTTPSLIGEMEIICSQTKYNSTCTAIKV